MVKQRTPDAPAADDAATFRDAVRDVKPLSHPAAAVGLAPPKPRRVRKPAALALIELDAVPMPSTAGDETRFQRAGVRNQVVRRLRRGLIPMDGELDLHGLTQSAARDRLIHFLSLSRAQGLRCVRIIHGKGQRSGGRGPVLKIAVDHWLRRHPEVLAFTPAKPIDGGGGAVYVLLRA